MTLSESSLVSEAVRQLFSEPEWLGFVDCAQQVPRASRAPLLQHQPAGSLQSRLLLRSLLRPFSLQPPDDGKRMKMPWPENRLNTAHKRKHSLKKKKNLENNMKASDVTSRLHSLLLQALTWIKAKSELTA